MRSLIVIAALVACGDDAPDIHYLDAGLLDSGLNDDPSWCELTRSTCNPLTQAGCAAAEKCTWVVEQTDTGYVGHVGCARIGSGDSGDTCSYGTDGSDTCKRGYACSAVQGGTGTCKQICDFQGGAPGCDDAHACVTIPNLFRCGMTAFAAAGVCEPTCDPLADNDFDGSGSASKSANVCGQDPTVGCYGYPSFGTPPRTEWSCKAEGNPAENLRHRAACNLATGCAEPAAPVGFTSEETSCSQGYLPMLHESTGSSTVICVALCQPTNCFAGNCGSSDSDRLGVAPHRCTGTDRVGTFDESATGEHCQYLWLREIDDSGQLLRSPTTDAVGICFDHSKYRYDSNGDGTPDTVLPPCAALQDGFGSGTDPADPLSYFGAADLGCVDSTRAVTGDIPRGTTIF